MGRSRVEEQVRWFPIEVPWFFAAGFVQGAPNIQWFYVLSSFSPSKLWVQIGAKKMTRKMVIISPIEAMVCQQEPWWFSHSFEVPGGKMRIDHGPNITWSQTSRHHQIFEPLFTSPIWRCPHYCRFVSSVSWLYTEYPHTFFALRPCLCRSFVTKHHTSEKVHKST